MEEIKILVVDDEPAVLDAMKQILSDFTVMTEQNALKAVERIWQERYDIFIVDYQMPLLNGIEVLEEIQEACPVSPYIGILSTASGTTYLFEEEREDKLFSFFLEKPVEAEKLVKILQKALRALGKCGPVACSL